MTVVIAFHTTDRLYTEAARRLRASAVKWNIPIETEAVDPGLWQDISAKKPAFILKMLDHLYPLSLLYTDADSVIEQPLTHLETFTDDVGYCARGGEILAGTIYIRNTAPSRLFLDWWIKNMVVHPKIADQATFQQAVRALGKTVKLGRLPAGYCRIFDLMKDEPAFITHYQASRVFKSVNKEKAEAAFLARMPDYSKS